MKRPGNVGLLLTVTGLALTLLLSLALIYWDRLPIDSADWPGADARAGARAQRETRAKQTASKWSSVLHDGLLLCGGVMAMHWARHQRSDDTATPELADVAQALRPAAQTCRKLPWLRQMWLLSDPSKPDEAQAVLEDVPHAPLGHLRRRTLKEAADTQEARYAVAADGSTGIDQIVPVRKGGRALLILRFRPDSDAVAVLDERATTAGVPISEAHGLRVAIGDADHVRLWLSFAAVALLSLLAVGTLLNNVAHRRRQRALQARIEIERHQREAERHQREIDGLRQKIRRLSATTRIGHQASALVHNLASYVKAIDLAAGNLEVHARNFEVDLASENAEVGRVGFEVTQAIRAQLSVLRRQVDNQSQLITSLTKELKGEPVYEPCNIATLVDESIAMLSHQTRLHRVRLVNQVNFSLPQQEIARGQLRDALFILIDNAVKSMADTATIENRRVLIDDLVVREPPSPEHPTGRSLLHLTVEDRGCGIAKDDWSRVFEADDSSSRPDGHGVGLWLARHLVEGMGGQLDIHKSSAFGTTMLIVLPYQSESESPHAANP